jgi:hypothetical protein
LDFAVGILYIQHFHCWALRVLAAPLPKTPFFFRDTFFLLPFDGLFFFSSSRLLFFFFFFYFFFFFLFL